MEKKAKMAKDTLGMEPAVHRKELEKRIDTLEKEMFDELNKIEKKVDQICTRMGLPLL